MSKVLFNDTGINFGRRGTQGGGDGEGQDGQGFGVGHLGQIEKWAVLLGFGGKVAKMAKMAKHF